MKIWIYLDPFSTSLDEERAEEEGLESGVDIEYRDFEEMLAETFPGVKLEIKRDVNPVELRNGRPDFYIWDIGGMCNTDITGSRRHNFTHEILRQLEDHPSTGFVPWTKMTQSSVAAVLQDFVLGRNADEIPDDYKEPTYPNLFMPKDRREWDFKEEAMEWMRTFAGLKTNA